MDISVVIPVYNEVEALPALYRELTDTLDRMPQSAEIVLPMTVRRTARRNLDTLAESDPRVSIASRETMARPPP
jgi:hypothetical protein